jgi:DNA-binding XRE family transcriptional regulator
MSLLYQINYNVCLSVHYSIFLYIYLNIMANKRSLLLPRLEKLMSELGENIKLARLRRKLSSQQVAERAGISRTTLVSIEKGYAGVSIGYYLNVLRVLGLENDILLIARDDELGRKLQDANLIIKKRAPKQ